MPVADADVVSVAELDRRLKRAVEGVSGDVWVEGEVTSAKAAPSGHVYFTLKDEREEAAIDCVLYRSSGVRARALVVDGARLQVRGRATVWAPRGKLQLVGDTARLAGRGALLEALEALKAKLAAEGLFAPERKRPLPREARVIGVVTSASGAAIHDIAKVAFRRGGARIVLSPALVQGRDAPRAIIDALDRLERVADALGVDAIIVGRGGGSSDDLMAFQDEAVVRRVAACRVPVVSAVGHEVDVTLVDLVADARAATPSQAAELLVPDSASREADLAQLERRLRRAMAARTVEDRTTIAALAQRTATIRLTVAERQQEVDDLSSRLFAAATRLASRRRLEVDRLHRRLAARHPRAVVAASSAALGPLEVRLSSAVRARLEADRARLGREAGRLHALSPLGVLGRGYAIATTRAGSVVRSVADVRPGEPLAVRVHDGVVAARVEGVEPGEGAS